MPPCLTQATPYKGFFALILIFVALEYFFNTVSDTKNAIFNSTRPLQYFDKASTSTYGPLLKSLFKNASNLRSLQEIMKSGNISDLHYLVTMPPFIASTILNNNKIMQEENSTKPLCPDISQNLYGRVQIQKYPVPSVGTLENRFASWLQPGGHWKPPNCVVEKKVAIVIPFKCRGEHLLLFLQHMHPFLKRQQLDYTIFVVEQEGDGPFNRAMLMNVGYVEALKLRKFDCFIFHDVDLLPEDDRNLYTCPEQPRHMSVAVDIFKYRLPYPAIFGGVSAISSEHFKLLNGFSNSFWGWGGEDDDMSNRIRYHHLYISRYPITIARYTMLTHKKDSPNPNRYLLVVTELTKL
ncbi:hypothetical protein ABEB36_008598 [Hypothenemus hampei]|uniref:Beta-1,4-N-acetylgalactosaminyltransferase n=1 Tax=Hypothenemus hampei TaxID=57062 RepID=A0ABD1ERG6_HYPHA